MDFSGSAPEWFIGGTAVPGDEGTHLVTLRDSYDNRTISVTVIVSKAAPTVTLDGAEPSGMVGT